MKQVNFSHEGGFPLEQETLERLQTAYRSELFEALKSHLNIEKNKDLILSYATEEKRGWVVIHQDETNAEGELEGILYPIQKGNTTGYLKTTRKGTNLVYGTGTPQTAYFDYDSVYIDQSEFDTGVSQVSDAEAVYFYDLSKFKVVLNIQTIENILNAIETNIAAIEANISALSNSVAASLALKADKTEVASLSNAVTASLALKADKTEVTNLSNTVTASLALKADKTEVNNALALKADLSTVVALSNRIEALENRTIINIPVGMIAMWGRPANEIPVGWREYTPLQGRMPVGFDSTQTEFNVIGKSGGAKSKKLDISELPIHSFTYSRIVGIGKAVLGFDGVGDKEGASYEDANTNSVGSGYPFSILNPYRVVLFIEYTGT